MFLLPVLYKNFILRAAQQTADVRLMANKSKHAHNAYDNINFCQGKRRRSQYSILPKNHGLYEKSDTNQQRTYRNISLDKDTEYKQQQTYRHSPWTECQHHTSRCRNSFAAFEL